MLFSFLAAMVNTDFSPPTEVPHPIQALYYQAALHDSLQKMHPDFRIYSSSIHDDNNNYAKYNQDGLLDRLLLMFLEDAIGSHYFGRKSPVYLSYDSDHTFVLLTLCENCKAEYKKRAAALCVHFLKNPKDVYPTYIIKALGHVGTEEDAESLMPWLFDPDSKERYSAATAISKIGGPEELNTLNVQLRYGKWNGDDDLKAFIKVKRDELSARLKKEEEKKAKAKADDPSTLKAMPVDK